MDRGTVGSDTHGGNGRLLPIAGGGEDICPQKDDGCWNTGGLGGGSKCQGPRLGDAARTSQDMGTSPTLGLCFKDSLSL